MLAVAEMYVKGVSTREAERVMTEFGLDSLSSTRLGRAAKLRDDELEARRTRPLGRIACLLLDARQEKVRQGGIVRDAAVLSAIAIAIAIGIGPEGAAGSWASPSPCRRPSCMTGLSGEPPGPRNARGRVRRLRRFARMAAIGRRPSADAGLRAARRAVPGGATRQRCRSSGKLSPGALPDPPHHLARNALHHAPSLKIRKRIGAGLREVWNAGSRARAGTALEELVGTTGTPLRLSPHGRTRPCPGVWPSSPCLALTARRLRISNPIEWAVQQELKHRTAKGRVLPDKEPLERLVSAVPVEIADKRAAAGKAYIKRECQEA